MNTIVKIAIGQTNIFAGNPEENLAKVLNFIIKAKKEKADIVVFPEMAVPGYMLSDLWEDDAFVLDCAKLSQEIRKASQGITVIFGSVLPDNRPSLFDPQRQSFGNDGRLRKFNAAFVFSNGQPAKRLHPLPTLKGQKILPDGVTIKTLQPLYREFEDQRHFLSLSQYSLELNQPLEDLLQPFKININEQSVNVGILICEDIWTRDYIYHGQPANPAKILVQNGAELLIAISSSPFGWRKFETRLKAINRVQKSTFDIGLPTPMVNVNCVGYQNNGKNEFGFDGRSTLHDANGNITFQAPTWEEGLYTTKLELGHKPKTFSTINYTATKKEQRQELHDALVNGLKEFALQKGIKNFVVGLSGGIDSALVAYLCVQAVGKDHVLAINMPSKFNSPRTKNTARIVAKNLGISYQIIPIEDIANHIRKKLNINLKKDQLVDENLQARIRSADILAGIAAKLPNTVYTSNGNKTEILLGYFTLDGDGRGAICPLGDVFKTDIASLATDINQKGKLIFPWELIAPIFDNEAYGGPNPIPANIKQIVPSAELSRDQNVDQGRGDPIIFSYHDRILRLFLEYRQDPENLLFALISQKLEELPIIKKNFTHPSDWISDLEKTWVLFHRAIYKQIQSPPIISVSKRSLGFDFRRSQTPAHFTQNYQSLKKQILAKNNWTKWV